MRLVPEICANKVQVRTIKVHMFRLETSTYQLQKYGLACTKYLMAASEAWYVFLDWDDNFFLNINRGGILTPLATLGKLGIPFMVVTFAAR